MTQVAIINTDNLDTGRAEAVEVHAPYCRHMAKYKKHPFYDGEWVISVDSPGAAGWAYNQDFILEADGLGEDPSDFVWDLAVFPCTGMVDHATVVNGL